MLTRVLFGHLRAFEGAGGGYVESTAARDEAAAALSPARAERIFAAPRAFLRHERPRERLVARRGAAGARSLRGGATAPSTPGAAGGP